MAGVVITPDFMEVWDMDMEAMRITFGILTQVLGEEVITDRTIQVKWL